MDGMGIKWIKCAEHQCGARPKGDRTANDKAGGNNFLGGITQKTKSTLFCFKLFCLGFYVSFYIIEFMNQKKKKQCFGCLLLAYVKMM